MPRRLNIADWWRASTADIVRVALATIALGGSALPNAAHAQRAYTVDDMLRLESMGNVSISKDGSTLIFDRYGPYDQQAAFDRGYIPGETRSKIYVVNLKKDAPPRLLFSQPRDRGFAHASISPDGRYILYTDTGRTAYGLGVASIADGTSRSLNFAAGNGFVLTSYWLGKHKFVLPALSSDDLARSNLGLRLPQLSMAQKWTDAFNGTSATASVIGSGQFKSLPESEGSLVVGDVADDSSYRISGGPFQDVAPSPDGTWIAAARSEQRSLDSGKRLNLAANLGRRLELTLFRASNGGSPLKPCGGCDILARSMEWTADGSKLAFFARAEGSDWASGQYRIYNPANGETTAIDMLGLRARTDSYGGEMSVKSTWLGARLSIWAEPTRKDAPSRRADWYLHDGKRLVNLTAGFASEPEELLGRTPDALIILSAGEIWKVEVSGTRTNLTASVPEKVSLWRAPTPFGDLPMKNDAAADFVTAQIGSEGGDPPQLLIINLRSGHITRFRGLSPESRFVALSVAGQRAVVVDHADNVTRLLVLGANGETRPIVTLNDHLRDVIGGVPVRIDHLGPKGDRRMSWILLPRNRAPGKPIPTIVNVYPGAVGRSTFSRAKIDEVSALNDHLLAAHGYAVLYPSIPVDYDRLPREPLAELSADVFAAVDAAIAKGYSDPERLGLQGHSYGGFAAGALVGLTSRFKSAVAMAGVYDQISAYGAFDVRQRLEHSSKGLDLFFVHSIESGQTGLGAAPWDDPERYLRNSPLMRVKQINTPIMLVSGDLDYIPTTQTEEFFTALTRLNKDAVMVRYWGEEHVLTSPANIRDLWRRLFDWYDKTLK